MTESMRNLARAVLDSTGDPDVDTLLRSAGLSSGYIQVGGDFGNPWVYGGVWYSPKKNELVVSEPPSDENEVDPSDIEVPGAIELGIVRRYTQDPALTTVEQMYEADHDDWNKAEAALEAWKAEQAEALEAARKRPVYRLEVAESPESWWDVPGMISTFGMSEEEWDKLNMVQRTIMAGEYSGWENFDPHPDEYTRRELARYLLIDM